MKKIYRKLSPKNIRRNVLLSLKKYSEKKFNLIPDYRCNSYYEKIFFCPCCRGEHEFLPLPRLYWYKHLEHGCIHSPYLIETINYDFYSCNNCGASDRDRLYALYFERLESSKKLELLDFAPSTALSNYLNTLNFVKRRTADLYMDNVDDKIDITDMNIYKNNRFDIFICSHILEHVADDFAALNELYRILKKGGWGILMVPINLGLEKIYEPKNYDTGSERWKHFGQNDHVRMYSKAGFIERVKKAGFKINVLGLEFFGRDQFLKYGITDKSVLYIVKKI